MDHRTRSSLALACLVLVTSAAAHVDGGGLLPHGRGLWALLGGMALLVAATRRLLGHRGGLSASLLLGQGLTHLAYQLGSCCEASTTASARHGMTMPGMPMDVMPSVTDSSQAMAGTGMGTSGTSMPMLACHLVAALVGLAVVAAARLARGVLLVLAEGLHDCLLALLGGVTHVVRPRLLPAPERRVRLRELLLATTAPRRGPPVVA